MIRRILLVLAACGALAGSGRAGEVTLLPPPGDLVIKGLPIGYTVTHTATSITISFPDAKPIPVPTPAPIINPPPAPKPGGVPRIFGHQDVILLFKDSVTVTGVGLASKLSGTAKDATVYALSVHDATGKQWLENDEFLKYNIQAPAMLITTTNASGERVLSYACPLPETDYDIAAVLQQSRRGQ